MGPSSEPELRKVIRLPHATALVVGTIIGSSIFLQPSHIADHVRSVPGVLMVWLAAGFVTVLGALVCAELASIFPRSGGVYVYLKEIFHPAVGFLWGWSMLLVVHSGIIAAVASIFATYCVYFFPAVELSENRDLWIKLIAAGAIIGLTAVNFFGVRYGNALQSLFTLGKLLAIALIIVIGFAAGVQIPEHFVVPDDFARGFTISDFGLAMVAGLFAYGGWHMVGYSAGETVDAGKTIPRALIVGTSMVTICYLLLNLVYMYLLPLDRVADSERIAADAAEVLFGGGGAVISALVVFSAFGALSGIILAGPRVYYAMAGDGLLFRWVGAIHDIYRTPYLALLIQALLSMVLLGTGTYRQLFQRIIFTEWIFFGLMAIGLVLLRFRNNVQRRYRMWGYPLTTVAFAVACFAIVANHLVVNPIEGIVGLSLVVAGIPVYFLWIYLRPAAKKGTQAP